MVCMVLNGITVSIIIMDPTSPPTTLQPGTTSSLQSSENLRRGRESRAMETLKMKDEQLKILSEHNSKLLASLEKV